jgi:betaine-aldehyde dehydrogenase
MKAVTEASRMLIGGQFVESESGEWLDAIDRSTEEPIKHVPAGDERDIARGFRGGESLAAVAGDGRGGAR